MYASCCVTGVWRGRRTGRSRIFLVFEVRLRWFTYDHASVQLASDFWNWAMDLLKVFGMYFRNLSRFSVITHTVF